MVKCFDKDRLIITDRKAQYELTHVWRALFRVFDIGFGQIEDISGIILVKEFFRKSNKKRSYGNFQEGNIHLI